MLILVVAGGLSSVLIQEASCDMKARTVLGVRESVCTTGVYDGIVEERPEAETFD